MRIRSLDDKNTELGIIKDDQGDVYVAIYTKENPFGLTVRIGGPASGHSVPPKVKQALNCLAHEFEVYKDCKNEVEAYGKVEEREELPYLNAQIASVKTMLEECPDDILMKTNMESHLQMLEEKRDKIVNKIKR